MTARDPLVGIVVLNYNGGDCLVPCLKSLQEVAYVRKFVVIVDNGSKDGSIVQAQALFPEHIYIFNQENRGFAAGMNVGIREALAKGAQYVWIFNNDAKTESDALAVLMREALKNEHAGLLSPAIYDSVTKKLWFGKGKTEYTRMRAVHVEPSHAELASGAFESEFLTGCALLMSRPLVEAIGYLDERFFLYYEDADFSLRAKEAGFSLVVVPEAKVWHAEQSNQSESKLYHLVLSGLLFFEKHGKGLWKPYFFVYGTIRRIKNRFDLLFGRKEAPLVRLAYNNFSHEHSSSHFPRVRQLP